MKVILKSLGGKGSKLHVDAEETVSSVKSKASKKLGTQISVLLAMNQKMFAFFFFKVVAL